MDIMFGSDNDFSKKEVYLTYFRVFRTDPAAIAAEARMSAATPLASVFRWRLKQPERDRLSARDRKQVQRSMCDCLKKAIRCSVIFKTVPV
jgi:hypothetical protein